MPCNARLGFTHRLLLVVALGIGALAVAAPPRALALTISTEQAGIANFGQVNDHYFRGAQPDRAGFQRLHAFGIKTVIDLQDKGVREEPAWVQGAGMQYYCIPLSSSRPATEAQTAHFLELINDPNNWPLYVHCAGGRHRTGEMTGIYRITHDGWTADKAFDEMKQYDYYSFPNHGSLKDYVYQYYDTFRTATAGKAATPTETRAGATTSTALSGSATP